MKDFQPGCGTNRHRALILLIRWLLGLAALAWVLGLPTAGAAVKYRVYGLNFSPYSDGQDPNQGAVISPQQLKQRLKIIAPYTRWIRTFGATHGLEETGRFAHQKGLKAAMGAWLGPVKTPEQIQENENQIKNLIARARKGQVDLAIVGSEVLLRGDLTPDQLLSYIRRVKKALPKLRVTYADTDQVLLDHPEIVGAVDVVFFNHYGYWQGLAVTEAVPALEQAYRKLVARWPGKKVMVSETGWPSCGNTLGKAVPSLQNASTYFTHFVSWARAKRVSYFHFEAFDENWKAAHEGPQGACWGLWDKNGLLKCGMRPVFNSRLPPESCPPPNPVPGRPGTAEISFIAPVPPFGSNDNLHGQVLHVQPAEYRVAVFIRVGTGWWMKPTQAQPLTPIRPDGTWECDITTGGNDPQANRIAAYLVPVGYTPPNVLGTANLPGELDQHALAKIVVDR